MTVRAVRSVNVNNLQFSNCRKYSHISHTTKPPPPSSETGGDVFEDTESGESDPDLLVDTVDFTMLAKLNFVMFWKLLIDKTKKVIKTSFYWTSFF